MSCIHHEAFLAEKTMNMFSNVDKSSKNPTTTTANTSTTSSTTKRPPLAKAQSCSDASPSKSSSRCGFITPAEFCELILQNSDAQRMPILDCRSQIDYGCERIRSSHNINCRTKIMARKLTSKRLEDVEPSLSLSLNNSDTVILYDQSTDVRTEEKIHNLPINLVVQAAQKSNKKVQIIQGGLDAVKTEYPDLIECPSETFQDKYEQDLTPPPPSPEAVDKENIVMSEILPQIFVGNTIDAQNPDRLNQHGITHIVNCTPDLPFYWANKYVYLRIDALDSPSQNIRKYFDNFIEFVDNALRSKTNNVLVHCAAGISRSPTLVLAYMMKKNRCTLDDAFEKMRKLRHIVDPNVHFIIQLREWEKFIMSNTATTNNNMITTAATDVNDDNSGINSSNSLRSTSNSYCGSTSKNKTDTKTCTDSAITVN